MGFADLVLNYGRDREVVLRIHEGLGDAVSTLDASFAWSYAGVPGLPNTPLRYPTTRIMGMCEA